MATTASDLDPATVPDDTAPDENAADGAAPVEETTPVAAFETGFDFDDDWCSRAVEDVVYDLVAETRQLEPALSALLDRELTGLDDYAAETRLKKYADDLEELIDDDEVDQTDETDEILELLRQAARDLTYCEHSCTCASDAYEDWGKEMLNEHLTDLGEHVWAVVREGHHENDPECDINGTLDLEDLYNALETRDGWTSCDLYWDGSSLTVKFEIYRSGSIELALTPLTEDQVHIWDQWRDAAEDEEYVAAALIAADPAALDATMDRWQSTEDAADIFESFDQLLAAVTAVTAVDTDRKIDDDTLDATLNLWQSTEDAADIFESFYKLLAAVTEMGPEQLADLDTDVAGRLAETWTGDLAQLLRTTLDVTGVPVTAFAA